MAEYLEGIQNAAQQIVALFVGVLLVHDGLSLKQFLKIHGPCSTHIDGERHVGGLGADGLVVEVGNIGVETYRRSGI